MYQALLQLGFLGIAGIIGIYGIVSGKLSWGGFFLLILLDVVAIVAGKIGKGVEKKARSLQVADSRLAEEYRNICNKWTSKPFPDF